MRTKREKEILEYFDKLIEKLKALENITEAYLEIPKGDYKKPPVDIPKLDLRYQYKWILGYLLESICQQHDRFEDWEDYDIEGERCLAGWYIISLHYVKRLYKIAEAITVICPEEICPSPELDTEFCILDNYNIFMHDACMLVRERCEELREKGKKEMKKK